MRSHRIAKRYGRALFELACESSSLDRILEDLQRLREAAQGARWLLRGLSDERIPLARRRAAAEKISGLLRLGDEVANLLRCLLDRGRAAIVDEVIDDFQARAERARHIAQAQVSVADRDIAREVVASLKRILEDVLGTKASCRAEVTPDLLAGFVLRLEGVRYDASLQGALARMQDDLIDGLRRGRGTPEPTPASIGT